MSDKPSDNDPDADDQLMREPAKHRLPKVARNVADEPVVEGAMGVLRAVQIRTIEYANRNTYDPRHFPEVSIALTRTGLPGRIVRMYERGPDEPPRAIKVRRETDGREIFMVWTSIIVRGARQFQWTSRGYQTRTGGMPTIVDLPLSLEVGSDHVSVTTYVLRWVFTVGAHNEASDG